MSEWKITKHLNVNIKKSILIEGMPGIGNVGKIAADLIVEHMKANKLATLFSTSLPNSVFVKEDNLVELPKIELYHKKKNNIDFLFLLGDVQPMNESDSYDFAYAVLDLVAEYNCKDIITLGGIGLAEEPPIPKVYCTGNNKKFISEFSKLGVDSKIYGVVGPIMGITGLLLGLAEEKKMRAIALLSETSAHPMHIGLKGTRELIKILQKKYGLGVNIKRLEKDIDDFENQLMPKNKKSDILEKEKMKKKISQDMSYIG